MTPFLSKIKNYYYLLPPIAVALAMLLFFAAEDLFPFGSDTIAWCDMDQQVVPLLMQFKDILAGKSNLLFNFKNAGGMNFYGVFFFFLASPFSFLVAFVDKSDISSFANVLVLLKMCAISLSASFYFYKKHPSLKLASVALSVLYAYSGYTMLYYQNVIWLDMACIFPLLLLSLDELKNGKRLFFILTLSACMFLNYYICYMIVVFLLLYAFLWAYLHNDKVFAVNFILSCLIAALVSAIVWIPCLLQYATSGRTTSVVQSIQSSPLITAGYTTFPTVLSFCFLVPFLFQAGTLPEKKHFFYLFVLTLLPVFIEPINKMWQTGNYMSFPTRYAFIPLFLSLDLSLSAFGSMQTEGEAISLKTRTPCNILCIFLCSAYTVFSFFYTLRYREVMDQYSSSLWGNAESFYALLILYAVMLAVGIAVFCLYQAKLLKPTAVFVGVAIIVLSELYVAPQTYMLTPAHSVASLQEIVDLEGKIDDEGFYRVKTASDYTYYDFDANTMGAIGYNAIGHYTSLTNKSYMTVIKQFGYSSYWMEVGNSGGSILSDALLSVGYTIGRGSRQDAIYQNESYHIVKNEYFLPLGIVTQSDLVQNQSVADYTDRGKLQKILATELLNDPEIVTVYNLEDFSNAEYTVLDDGTTLLHKGFYHLNFYTNDEVCVYFNVFGENTNALNQSINGHFSVYSQKCTVLGYPSQKDNGFVALGEYEGKSVSVRLAVDADVSVSSCNVFTVDKNRLADAIESADTVGFTEKNGRLLGSYRASGGECVFLSVGYDEAIRVKINGKRVAHCKIYDGFIGFYLSEGDNEIEISYLPKGFACGSTLTLLGIALSVSAVLQRKKLSSLIQTGEGVQKISAWTILVAGVAVALVIYIIPLILSFF